MTQLYRVDKRDWDSEDEVALLVNEWAQHHICYHKMVQYENITQDEADNNNARGSPDIAQFAALYRKDGRNYLWRGRRVPMTVRYRLQSMMYAENAAEQNEGTILLYKTGGSGRESNQSYYPVRMSGNKYVFVLGSVAHFQQWLSENTMDDTLWKVWAAEHLVDWAPHMTGFEYNRARSRYAVRSQYVYLMDQYLSSEDYSSLYERYAAGGDVRRAAYCVWQDGAIIEWVGCGQEIHPKI